MEHIVNFKTFERYGSNIATKKLSPPAIPIADTFPNNELYLIIPAL